MFTIGRESKASPIRSEVVDVCGLHYHEDQNAIVFEWEFGGNATALIGGAKAGEWDRRYPWAAGRQAEIYDCVAKETIRQKSPGSRFESDLASGFITIR